MAICKGDFPYGTDEKGPNPGEPLDVGSYRKAEFEKAEGSSDEVPQCYCNAQGFYDLCGNVSEWTADWYGQYPTKEMSNPTGPKDGTYRVLRGGDYTTNCVYCRSACRDFLTPGIRNPGNGLRICLIPEK